MTLNNNSVNLKLDEGEWKKIMTDNGLAPLNLRGDDFQAFVKGSVDEITAISKEIGLIK